METRNDPETKQKVWDMIKDIKFAQMVTRNAAGRMSARPMTALKREGDVLWFMTSDETGKIDEIEKDPEVLLSFNEPKNNSYVSISGKATVTKDRAKIDELWSEFSRIWFPKGKDDPRITLIRVDAEAAEYWDSPKGILVYAWGYVQARITGEVPKSIGDAGHVDIKAAS